MDINECPWLSDRDTDLETTVVMEPGRKDHLLSFIFFVIPVNFPVWRRRPMATPSDGRRGFAELSLTIPGPNLTAIQHGHSTRIQEARNQSKVDSFILW